MKFVTSSSNAEQLSQLIERWKSDPGSTYQKWFLWEERLKNFRSIRRGLQQVIREISEGTFGNAYRGSSLETVVRSIAEQRQLFKGADHAFLWKPKLRIPDIYENSDNQRAFGIFLNVCLCCTSGDAIVDAIHVLDSKTIKGLGPAAANLLYFLHPTFAPPSNTAMVNGYNALTGAKVKLGRWKDYLAMREGILRINADHRDALSNDLGAIAGLLFDIGTGRYAAPPREADEGARTAWETDLARVREDAAKLKKSVQASEVDQRTHAEIQAWLRDVGLALGFDVWIAANDQSRLVDGKPLATGCRRELPAEYSRGEGTDAVRLIDVLWLDRTSGRIAAGFEVEHSTSIYSGIVRLLDLALGVPDHTVDALFLVAPDER
ncbi:MAG TPA: type II restriction endonuclease, partial [Vicinamibacterales bacterium]|nr:type II restriction endonuclease [Vicinamibacterales bacterium]